MRNPPNGGYSDGDHDGKAVTPSKARFAQQKAGDFSQSVSEAIR
jgi:hypothetical protein